MRRRQSFALLLFFVSASLLAQVRPTTEDLVALRGASSPRLSPDGKWVAYVLSSRKLDAVAAPADDDREGGWKTERQLYVVPAGGGEPRQLTFGKENPGSPEWSPDGSTVAFLRARKIHLMRMDGGEPRAVGTGSFEPRSFAFSPDGKSIAFTATAPLSADEKKERWRSGGA